MSPAPGRGSGAGDEAASDGDAIRRVRAGDRDAFRILVERYQGRAYRLALRVLRDEEEARDAVQEAFLKAYGALDRFQGRSRFYTWLYRLVMNQCLDQRRRDRSDRHTPWEEGSAAERETAADEAPEVLGVRFAPAAEAMGKELRGHLARAIDALPEASRATLLLREVDGLSYAEIAEALAIPKGTVMSRLHYARQQVKRRLIEAGMAEPVAADPQTAGVPAGTGEDA